MDAIGLGIIILKFKWFLFVLSNYMRKKMLKKVLSMAVAMVMLAACQQNNAQSVAGDMASDTNQPTHADLIERINHKGKITVGTEGTYAPFTFHGKDNRLTGYDVEVTRAVANKLGVEVEFKETNWDSMLIGLKSGKFDMVANQVSLTTPERQATFDKSEPYSWSGPMMLARKDDNHIKSLEDIKGLRAAQSITSNYNEMAMKAQAVNVPVDGMAQALLLVQQKRADVTLNDSLALLDFLKNHPDSGLKSVWQSNEKLGSGLILNKGNDEALSKINSAMEKLREDGTLKKLGEQFFGKDVSIK